MNQLHHFTGQEPALSSLITFGHDRPCHLGQITDVGGRMEMAALSKSFIGSLTNPVNCLDAHISNESLGLLEAQILGFEILVIEAVGHKVDQIRYYRLSAFRFQKLCKMIVCCWKEFYQDLTYNTNTWFLLVADRDGIKIMNHLPAHFLKLAVA